MQPNNIVRYLLVCAFALATQTLYGQKLLAEEVSRAEVEQHVRFLASDELAGRKAGYVGNNVAARHIAEHFRRHGVQKVPGKDTYYQTFFLGETTPAKQGALTLHDKTWTHGEEMLVMAGSAFQHEGEVVFIGYGAEEADYQEVALEGKIVLTRIGSPNQPDAFAAMRLSEQKQKFAQQHGAVALIELYNLPVPWNLLKNYLRGSRMEVVSKESTPLPTFWLNDASMSVLKQFNEQTTAPIRAETTGTTYRKLPTQNVVGYVEGTDPKLKEEYILLTAHYDHIGSGTPGVTRGVTAEDSIFNGARDNAIGTTAVLTAARMFAKNPPKRSVLFIAYTAEEDGLLGSQFYAANPWLPLNKGVFNLNIDGAGYNSTEIVTVIGLERTGAKDEVEKATAAFGLRPIDDPAPEQGLFDRSDNVSLAAKGVPAPTFSLGFTAFDAEIGKYYHQVTDGPETVDFDYVLKFCRAYLYTAELIANRKTAPQWKKGDKYEEAAKQLYGNK